ncbi:Low specificity L-threonine aldolase [Methylobrevis pamukkalensis]|uniref:L-threonine aldolase n=2 Tax=Methylobrevis pamukkalensis TaxID=1439726 RepID=A0A1E3H3U0_9HYPH|nr:low specificity L-threonine aldolase [Methylobrevis pamukkalensis]ODN70989.1 Low specificity L-threonine aldolase [Methylobrevis pamukkalensis]
MNFSSDNWAGASPKVSAALERIGGGYNPAYGNDDRTQRVSDWFCEIFEREVAVFFVGTGSAANSLALAAMMRPGGLVFCHRQSHINVDECGAPEFFTGGGKLVPLPGAAGKLDAATLARALGRFDPPSVHSGRPVAVSITQSTEAGTVYTPAEIRAIADVAHGAGLQLHMDGARFANALASLNVAAADITWRAGVDVLSFGATKNGCWCAEAVVFFDRSEVGDFEYLRKRSGQLFSKSAFVAAQFEGYFEQGHWLDNAVHANHMAERIGRVVAETPGARLAFPVEANEVFAIWPKETTARLKAAGASFYVWPGDSLADGEGPGADEDMVRLVTSYATRLAEVAAFIDVLQRLRV